MRVFEFSNYKLFLKDWLKRRPKQGRGELLRFADHLSVHPTLVSQVINGEKDFSPEHALALGEYLGLDEPELEYFLLLVHLERAGSKKLRIFYEQKVQRTRAKNLEVVSRLPKTGKALSKEQRAQFYSDWLYSAVRLLTSIDPPLGTADIARRLEAAEKDVQEVVDFLVAVGLCKQTDGKYEVAVQRTHISPDSRLVNRHHTNWRLRAIQKMEKRESKDLFFTAPLTLSDQDFHKLRTVLLETIEDIGKTVEPSPAQTLACINLDWYRV